MIKRLPRYAETELQRLCAKAGALCHAVDEDESGWDRLIEFPEKEFAGPADTRPPRAVAYVQVKSVEKGTLTCRLKLSNALRAAQSPQPWFIVLVTAETHNQRSMVYAVHFWEELIRRTLEAVRRAHNEKRPLHKSSLSIRFGPSDEKGGGLVQWMQQSIDSVRPEYETAKRAINRTAGYEDGCGVGVMTIEANSEEEILKNFLGLGDGLRLNKFTFTPSRFGISSPLPQTDMSSGVVHITPQPAGEVEIRLRSPATSRTIVLQGHAYGAGLPEVPDDQKRYRFSAGFLEMLWRPGVQSDFTASLDGSDKLDLSTIESYIVLNEWLAQGAVDLQVWVEGKRAIWGTVNSKNSTPGFDWPKLTSALRLLRSIAGHQNPKVSLHDISNASGLRTFAEVTDANSLCLEFEPLPNAPTAPFTTIVYWFHVDVGDHAFYALAERSVVEDIVIDGGKRRVTAGRGRIVESYVLKKPSDSERKMMERDYARHRDLLQQSGMPLELGDLRAFIGASAGSRSTAA